MKVALITDNVLRDLPGLLLVALSLCQRGVVCYLVSLDRQQREIGSLIPDFVLLNYLRRTNQSFAKGLLNAGIKIGILDTEGIFSNFKIYSQIMTEDKSIRQAVSCYCCWGSKLADYIKKHKYYPDRKVFITGSPRYDFYADLWRPVTLKASEFIEKYEKPRVLINSNFPLANPYYTDNPMREINLLVNKLKLNSKEIIERQKEQTKAMHYLIEMVNKLAVHFPHVTFIFRPHPFENIKIYKKMLNKRKNLHLVKKGTVEGWIIRSQIIIQKSCLTGLEAGFAGIPTLSPEWVTNGSFGSIFDKTSILCKNQADLEKKLTMIIEEKKNNQNICNAKLEKLITDWIFKLDGLSHQRVANRIMTSLALKSKTENNYNKFRKIHYNICQNDVPFGQKMMNFMRYNLSLPSDFSYKTILNYILRVKEKDKPEKAFSANDIRTFIKIILKHSKTKNLFVDFNPIIENAKAKVDYHFGFVGKAVKIYPV